MGFYKVKVRPGQRVLIGDDISVEWNLRSDIGRSVELTIRKPPGVEVSVEDADAAAIRLANAEGLANAGGSAPDFKPGRRRRA